MPSTVKNLWKWKTWRNYWWKPTRSKYCVSNPRCKPINLVKSVSKVHSHIPSRNLVSPLWTRHIYCSFHLEGYLLLETSSAREIVWWGRYLKAWKNSTTFIQEIGMYRRGYCILPWWFTQRKHIIGEKSFFNCFDWLWRL